MASVNGVANTLVNREEWELRLQMQLDAPTRWKEISDVTYTNMKVINNPYHSDPVVQNLDRGSPYTFSPITETNQSVTVNRKKISPVFIDRADYLQSTFLDKMRLAERQAITLNEEIETSVLANHANWTNFGAGDITGGTVADTTQITVSDTNIDDIIRHVSRVIAVAGGESLFEQEGGFIMWRPADFAILQGFLMANGYTVADFALRKGIGQGIEVGGIQHYRTNFGAANHVMAGVKKANHLYILKGTYGQVMIDENDPNSQSGIAITSRVDYKEMIWNNFLPITLDINVA